MKKVFVVLAILAIMMVPVRFALADQTQEQAQAQSQAQSQAQAQSQNAYGGAGGQGGHGGAGGSVGDTTANGVVTTTVGGQANKQVTNIKTKIPAPSGAMGGFVIASGLATAMIDQEFCDKRFSYEYMPEDIMDMAVTSGGSRRGTFWYKIFNGRLTTSGHVPEKLKANANSPIEIVCDVCLGTKQFMTVKMEGKYGVSLFGTTGEALAVAKAEGARYVSRTFDVRIDPKASAGTIGLGGANDSITIGASWGETTTSMFVAYDVTLTVLSDQDCDEQSELEVVSPPPPPTYEQPEPKKPCSCNANEIREKIKQLELKCKDCLKWCFNNLTYRVALEKLYIELSLCTGDKQYLQEAKRNHRIANDNYRFGHDIASHQTEADQLITEADFYHSGLLFVTEGEAAAICFAQEKKLERYVIKFLPSRTCEGFETEERMTPEKKLVAPAPKKAKAKAPAKKKVSAVTPKVSKETSYEKRLTGGSTLNVNIRVIEVKE